MFSGLFSAVASSLMGVMDTTLTSALPGNSTRHIIYKNKSCLGLEPDPPLSIPDKAKRLFSANFKTSFGALPASYSMGTGGSYTGAKAARV